MTENRLAACFSVIAKSSFKFSALLNYLKEATPVNPRRRSLSAMLVSADGQPNFQS